MSDQADLWMPAGFNWRHPDVIRNNAEFYTYFHYRCDDGLVFYVGKGKDRRAWSKKSRSKWWKSVVAKHGIRVEIVAYWQTEAEALEHEKFLIASMRSAGAPLTNLTNGGEGFTGGRHSDEYRERLRIDLKNPDRQRRMAEANRGRKLSPEHIAKLRGRKLTDEHRAKVAAANLGAKRSNEAREAMRQAKLGTKQSPETIAKRKATWAAKREAI